MTTISREEYAATVEQECRAEMERRAQPTTSVWREVGVGATALVAILLFSVFVWLSSVN